MQNIDNLEYGYDQEEVETYLKSIESGALEEAKKAVMDIDKITKVCEEEWQGKARENFVENLKKDAAHVSEQFGTLYEILTKEVRSVQAAMANKDEELIKLD